MVILRHLEHARGRFPAPVLTLGTFDGVHRGHQEILHRVVARAREVGGTPIAMTFHPHPAAILAPARTPRLLTDWRGRIERIAATGIETIVMQHFTRAFSEITAPDFVRRFLVGAVGVHSVVVGHRVSFGHHREGTAESLRQFGAQYGFEVEIIGPVDVDGVTVSSSAVRRAVSAGELERACAYLGRPPSVSGRVVRGHQRGKRMGFPTANLRIAGMVVPPDGVYAVRVRTAAGVFPGVANLGLNPTFADHIRHLEAHLFDVVTDLYRQRIEVCFVQRLRGERKFPNMQALAEQIARDADAARRALQSG